MNTTNPSMRIEIANLRASIEREIYIAGCVDDQPSPRFLEFSRCLDDLNRLEKRLHEAHQK